MKKYVGDFDIFEVRAPAVGKDVFPARLGGVLPSKAGDFAKMSGLRKYYYKFPPLPPIDSSMARARGAGSARPPAARCRAAGGGVPSSSILSYCHHSKLNEPTPPNLRKSTNERSVGSLRE